MAKVDFKQVAINHVEKAIFGIVMVVVLLGLIGAKWSPYQGTPGEITQKAQTGERNLSGHGWPDEDREQFPIVKTDSLVDLALYSSIDPRPLENSISPIVDPVGRNEPVSEPVWKAPENLIATSTVAFLQLAGPADEEDAEDSETDSEGEDEADKDDEDIDDELRVREKTAGVGAGRGLGGTEGYAGGGYGGGGYLESAVGLSLSQDGDAGGTAAGMTELSLSGEGDAGYLEGRGAGMMGAAKGPKLNGQGYSLVAVRAVFPLRDQISKFVDATHLSYSQAAAKFEISDFELQRQTAQKGATQWPEGEDSWEPVDINVAGDILDSAAGFETDVVSSVVTNAVMTMPLPMRISGVWKTQASHPRIKNFELSEKQMDVEMKMNRALLQEAVESNKKERETAVQRRGFSQFQFDTRDVQGSLLGNDNVYAGMGGGSGGGGYGGSSGMGMGMEMGMGMGMEMSGGGGRGGGRGGRPRAGASKSPLDTLIENLAKQDGGKNTTEKEKLIREWIMTRVSVDGELLLFRYFDFSVEPGKTYRYRVRLILQNPNFGRRIADAGGLAHVVAGKTRTTDWSNITPAVTVKKTTRYFLTRLNGAKGNARPLPSAQMDVYHWDSDYGTMVNKAFEVRLGQPIADEVETEVIDAAGQEVKEMDYTFTEESFLVDAIEDFTIDRSFHSNDRIDPALQLNLIRGHRDHFRNEGQVLVKEDEGELVALGEAGNAKDRERMSNYMETQKNRTYKHLFEAEKSLSGAEGFGDYSDLLGASGFGMEGGSESMMMGGGAAGGSRRGSALRRKSGRGGRSGGGRGAGPPGGAY